MTNLITIKSLEMPKFTVELLQDNNGRYVVRFITGGDPEQYTKWTHDYSMASYMFDMKIRDLEGN